MLKSIKHLVTLRHRKRRCIADCCNISYVFVKVCEQMLKLVVTLQFAFIQLYLVYKTVHNLSNRLRDNDDGIVIEYCKY